MKVKLAAIPAIDWAGLGAGYAAGATEAALVCCITGCGVTATAAASGAWVSLVLLPDSF